MHKIKVQLFIEAAHQLPDSDDLITKKCANLHGHTYYVIAEAVGQNDKHGMLIDFKAIKEVINILDHQFINDIFEEAKIDRPTTAENIALFIHTKLLEAFPFLWSLTVKVCEGYHGPETSSWVEYPV